MTFSTQLVTVLQDVADIDISAAERLYWDYQTISLAKILKVLAVYADRSVRLENENAHLTEENARLQAQVNQLTKEFILVDPTNAPSVGLTPARSTERDP